MASNFLFEFSLVNGKPQPKKPTSIRSLMWIQHIERQTNWKSTGNRQLWAVDFQQTEPIGTEMDGIRKKSWKLNTSVLNTETFITLKRGPTETRTCLLPKSLNSTNQITCSIIDLFILFLITLPLSTSFWFIELSILSNNRSNSLIDGMCKPKSIFFKMWSEPGHVFFKPSKLLTLWKKVTGYTIFFKNHESSKS